MDRTTAANFATVGGLRAFQNANPSAGISEGTAVSATDLEAFQEEIMGIIEGAGLTGNAGNLKQAFKGVQTLIAASAGIVGFVGYDANETLTNTVTNNVVQAFGETALTFILPLGSTMRAAGLLWFMNDSGGVLTITPQGSDILVAGGGSHESVLLQPGDTLVVLNRQSGPEWDIIGGSAALQFVTGLVLSGYPTSAAVASAISTALAAYVTSTALASALSAFVTSTAVAAAIAAETSRASGVEGSLSANMATTFASFFSSANQVQFGPGGSGTAEVSFTSAVAGIVVGIGSRNASSQGDGAEINLVINGSSAASDNLVGTGTLFGGVGVAAGTACSVALETSLSNAFSANVLAIFIPTSVA
jgi:hypothetical protein